MFRFKKSMFKIKGTRQLEKVISGAVIFLLIMFSIIIEIIGYNRFTRTYTKEYNDSAYKTGLTAEAIINADNIDLYLESEGSSDEYKLTNSRLNILTNKMDVSVVYVIKPINKYKQFISIFNCVNDNSGYKPWGIGTIHKTSSKEYEKYYRQIMENKIDRATVIRKNRDDDSIPHITSLIPIKNSNGDVVSILCVQRFMTDLKHARHEYVYTVTLLTFVLILLSFLIVRVFIRNQIVKPVIMINEEAKRFANEDVKTHNSLKKISKISEMESIALSIDKMEKDMIKYIDNLTDVTKEKERIGTELRLASSIQEKSLPNIFPPYPDRREFDLFASMKPAKEVGGDFYDFYLIDDDHICLVMADVSGKGIPAALFMMVTKILINVYSYSLKNPGEILTAVNERICSNNKANMFITVWLGILEISTGKLVASNAGHEDPAICKKNGNFEIDKKKHGIPVGAMEDYEYKNYNLKLDYGDKLFLYTDGVPEATNNNDEMFGLDKMIDSLNKVKNCSCKDILVGVKCDVDKFVDDAIQFDDLTMLCFEYIGKVKKNKSKKTFNADVKELDNVLSFVHGIIDGKVNNKISMKLDVVIEEIFVNICNYAYEESGFADIEVLLNKNKLSITFIDEGIPFNPLEKDEPDISLSSEDRKVGGLGIFMVKKIMDNVEYKYENNKNILIIEKDLGGE